MSNNHLINLSLYFCSIRNICPIVLTHITDKYIFQRCDFGFKNHNIGTRRCGLVGRTYRIGAKHVVSMRQGWVKMSEGIDKTQWVNLLNSIVFKTKGICLFGKSAMTAVMKHFLVAIVANS